MRALRVAYLAERARALDGWGRYAVELLSAVRACGVDPVLVTAASGVDPVLAGIEHHPVLPSVFGPRGQIVRLLAAVPRLRPVLAACDVVHCLVEPYLPLAALACPRARPLVQTAHGTWAVWPLRTRVRRVLHGRALRRVDLLVCQSRFTCGEMARFVRLPPHAVLPAGVDPNRFSGPAMTDLPSWVNPGPIVLGVGALKSRKGHHVSVEALARLTGTHATARLVIIGTAREDDPYAGALRRQAERLGVAARLHLLGQVTPADLVAWYQHADVLLLPAISEHGRFEGLGLVYLEAAAAGVPAIGTLGSGAETAIVDGETGLLVAQRDAGATAAALDRLLSDAALRRRMGEAASARAPQFAWSRLASALADRYRELADPGSAALT